MMIEESKKKIAAYFSQYKTTSFKKGEIILQPGDEAGNIYYVSDGYVRLYCVLEDGRELTLNIFKKGSYFPMYLALQDSPNLHYYQTITEATMHIVPKQKVMDFFQKNPEALFEFTVRIVVGLYGLLSNIQYLLFGSVHSRVLSALLFMAKRFGEKRGDNEIFITLPVTHQDMANLVGITRETTSLEMKKLADQKLISYKHKHIIILNRRLLEQEAGVDENAKITDYSL